MVIKECGGWLVWCDENCEACLAARTTASTEETDGTHEKSKEKKDGMHRGQMPDAGTV